MLCRTEPSGSSDDLGTVFRLGTNCSLFVNLSCESKVRMSLTAKLGGHRLRPQVCLFDPQLRPLHSRP